MTKLWGGGVLSLSQVLIHSYTLPPIFMYFYPASPSNIVPTVATTQGHYPTILVIFKGVYSGPYHSPFIGWNITLIICYILISYDQKMSQQIIKKVYMIYTSLSGIIFNSYRGSIGTPPETLRGGEGCYIPLYSEAPLG